MLSFKLAHKNIRKGFQAFAPFLMASITMFVMLFVTASIGLSPTIEKLPGGNSVAQLMGFALLVLIIFSLMILVYSYRFLQLQRSREFGLYDILGFGKTSIIKVAFWELLLTYLMATFIGTIVGIAFSKFLYLIFVNLIGGDYFNLVISPLAIALVAGLYLLFFLVLLVIGAVLIMKSSSLDLLREESKGEKEPKSNLFMAVLALIFLAAGYFIALTVDNPIVALLRFFIAVLLVIFGTYFFYISFTVWYLKRRKKQDSYYQPHYFITISSMLYRMKANAVGLGNITILLSMTVVTVVVSLGVFFGTSDMVETQFPKEAQIISTQENNSRAELTALTEQIATESGTSIENLSSIYVSQDVEASRAASSAEEFVTQEELGSLLDENHYLITMTTAESLLSLGNEAVQHLSENQVMLVDLSEGKASSAEIKTVNWHGQTYQVAGHLTELKNFPVEMTMSNSLMLVFANEATLNRALAAYNQSNYADNTPGMNESAMTLTLFDLPEAEQARFETAFNENQEVQRAYNVLTFRSQALQNQKAQIGGFVFIGFVLGISFILGAALIIYYKQLSEGTQDKRSFKILQEAGFSKEQVQKTIRSQVRMIFFLPLLITVLHFAGAYRMISQMIMLFGVTDGRLTLVISLLTLATLVAVYYLIYKATSRVYYKIVER